METRRQQVDGYLLSPQQSRLWRLQEAFQPIDFRTQFIVLIEGMLEKEILRAGLEELIERHAILRTRFIPAPNLLVPVQVIGEQAAFSFEEIDLEGGDPADAEATLEQHFQSALRAPIDFAAALPLIARLYKLNPRTHALLISLPSLCADASSVKILFEELTCLYAGRVEQDADQQETFQYIQFAEWQNNLLAGNETAASSGWAEITPSLAAETRMPFARREGSAPALRLQSQRLTLGRNIADGLKEAARAFDGSAASVLLACWQVLLWRFSGQPEPLIGYTTEGRQYAELDGMPGLIDKAVPIQARLLKTDTFAQVMKRAEADSLRVNEEQATFGFPRRDAENDTTPMRFSTGFAFARAAEKVSCRGAEFSLGSVYSCAEPFDLRLFGLESEGEMTLCLDFNSEIYDPAYIAAVADSLLAIVEDAARSPEKPIGELRLLTEEAESRLLIEFNDTSVQADLTPVHIRFAQMAEQVPDALAVTCGSRRLTFAELDAKANQLAHYLIEMGVGPETRVGLLLDPSPEMVIAILGVLKASGAYLPLDPLYPKDRLAFVLEDSGVLTVLTNTPLSQKLSETAMTMINMNDISESLQRCPATSPAWRGDENNLAYVIYTSGSTGRPKGVMVTHRELANYIDYAVNAYEVERGDGAPLHSSIAFDLSVTALFAPLLCGRAVILDRAAGVETLAAILKATDNLSFVKLTPAHLRMLGQQLSAAEATGKTRMLIVGGEALTPQDVCFWREHAPETVIVNEYGPTEAVVGCCAYRLPMESLNGGSIPIGRPVINARLYVLDESLRPVPVGVPGQLLIGGEGLARGYLNRPELTAEKFIPDPFADSPGGRLYQTGDLACFLPDGNLEFLRRMDDQVKIRGYRVELGEIEAVLKEYPAVRDATVIAKNEGLSSSQLVAYVVFNSESDQGNTPSPEDLRAHLASKLPDYMLPAFFIALESLPLSANGKVDRAALPDPAQSGRQGLRVAPRTPEEQVLAGIWSQVLGVKDVGIDDGYFNIGGDSIRSLQVIARAQERGLNFTIDQLFQYQTIRELARVLKTSEVSSSIPAHEPFSLICEEDRAKIPAGVEDAYPLSQLQAGMVFHRELHPETSIYHDVFGYQIKAPLDVESLREAIQQIVVRHPMLRTSFDLSSFSQPLQLVHREAACPLAVDDISALSEAEQEAALLAFMEAEKKRDFDYATPPLLRFHLHVRGASRFQFWVSFHHAILDGWSDISMLVELFLSYNTLLKGDAPDFAPPATTYSEFIALEKAALESQESRRFWKELLAEAELAELPRFKRLSARESPAQDSARYSVAIADEVSTKVQELAQLAAVPIKSVLLAAHMRVMGFLSGKAEALTLLVSVGRPETIDGDRVLGLHLNSLPFRTWLRGGSWLELVKEVFDLERRLLPRRRLPMAEMQRMMGVDRFAETLFYFTHYYNILDLSEFPEMEVVDWYGYEESSFTLSAHFSMHPHTSRVALDLYYDHSQLSEDQVESIASYYHQVLETMSADPSARYAVDLLPEKEKRRLLGDWNNTAVDYSGERCAHRLFELQADTSPSAIALLADGRQLTYSELERAANRLAHALKARGVGPESIVGILTERSPEMVTAILGVLKAGAAYLPIDPTQPSQRISFMLKDAAVAIVLVSERTKARLPQSDLICINLDGDAARLADFSDERPAEIVRPENAAYTIYTSGSTGEPKGVVVSHRALSNHNRAIAEHYGLRAGDRVLQFAAPGFDVAVEEILPTLISGAAVVPWPEQSQADYGEFLRFVERHQITIVNLPAAFWEGLVSALGGGSDSLPRSLRLVITGSDTVSPAKLAEWRGIAGDHVAWTNSYGVTEAAITSTIYDQETGEPSNPSTVPIGRPIANTRAYVLDALGNPAPTGVAGALCIGGAGLARGYLNRPDLTAEKFAPDSISGNPGTRLYMTGDRARFLPDGNLEFLGRQDQQVKIRGFRIEPAEIESVLRRHPLVASAVVVVKEYARGDKQLVAYVTTATAAPTADELRAFMRTELPEYMIPAAIVSLGHLPLTSSGKVDRRALPEPGRNRQASEGSFVAARTAAEEIVAAIWVELLSLDGVGVRDSFFDLGGHSLLATQAAARIRAAFQLPLPLADLYERPTIEGVIASLSRAAGDDEVLELIAQTRKEIDLMPDDEVRRLVSE